MMTNPSQYCLQYKKASTLEWENYLFGDQVDIGSGQDCDLVLVDGELSDIHFEIRENPAGIFIKDMDKESGRTFLDGQLLEAGKPLELPFGSIIQAGGYEFRLLVIDGGEGTNIETGAARSSQPTGLKTEIKNVFQQTGLKKLMIIGAGLLVVAVIGALSIYQFVLRPRQSAMSTVTSATEQATQSNSETEAAATAEFVLESTAVLSETSGTIQAPGEGDVTLESLLLNLETMELSQLYELMLSPESTIDFAADIVGDNIAFVYAYAGIVENGRVVTTAMEFVYAEDSQNVDGVIAPDWGDEPQIPVEFAWKPIVYRISDGSHSPIALLVPERYGFTDEDQVYDAEGIFQPNNSQSRYEAILRFASDGSLIECITYGMVGAEHGMPYQATLKPGDTFTLYESEFKIDEAAANEIPLSLPESVLSPELQALFLSALEKEIGYQFGPGTRVKTEGDVLVYGDSGFTWHKDDQYEGEFVAGVAVQDLDSQFFIGYIPLLVTLP